MIRRLIERKRRRLAGWIIWRAYKGLLRHEFQDLAWKLHGPGCLWWCQGHSVEPWEREIPDFPSHSR